MTTVIVCGVELKLKPGDVIRTAADLEPEPLQVHYVVIGGRRYPPKQILAAVSGLDRGDFTTHQARSILRRLGFGVHRLGQPSQGQRGSEGSIDLGPVKATVLDAYGGRWIAQQGQDVVFDAESPEAVISWLRRHGLAARVWRVPAEPSAAGSALSAG